MALKRLMIDGYGQIELNNFAAPRDGRVEAQCALSETDFATVPAENGMLLAVDNVTRTLGFPADNEELPVGLNYSSEHMYEETKKGLKNFKIDREANGDYFFPRLGYLAVGDKFTTNCIAYDDGEYEDDTALIAAVDAIKTTPLYATTSTIGAIKVTATKPAEGVCLKVVKKTTMPDGQFAVKLQAIRV